MSPVHAAPPQSLSASLLPAAGADDQTFEGIIQGISAQARHYKEIAAEAESEHQAHRGELQEAEQTHLASLDAARAQRHHMETELAEVRIAVAAASAAQSQAEQEALSLQREMQRAADARDDMQREAADAERRSDLAAAQCRREASDEIFEARRQCSLQVRRVVRRGGGSRAQRATTTGPWPCPDPGGTSLDARFWRGCCLRIACR